MSVTINTNIASMIAQYNLGKNTTSLNKTTERLASGLKINHSSDDSAGLSISEKLRTQCRGLQRASENAQDGINLLQIAEGGLEVIVENIQRIRELTVQAANDTNSSIERNAIKEEVKSRIDDIHRVKAATNFNNITLLDGSVSKYVLRVGANSDTTANTLDITDALDNAVHTFLSNYGTAGAISTAFASGTNARAFIFRLDEALASAFGQRAKIGAYQGRLQSTVTNLEVSRENMLSAESRIRNVDIAESTGELAKWQLLQQASMNVVAQANQMPALAIELLKQSAF